MELTETEKVEIKYQAIKREIEMYSKFLDWLIQQPKEKENE